MSEKFSFDPQQRLDDNYSIYCEGDAVKSLQKKIVDMIVKTESYIVFLDEDATVQWATNDSKCVPPSARPLLDQVAYLETVSGSHFGKSLKDKQRLREFRRLLAEVVGSLMDGEFDESKQFSKKAEEFLVASSEERARVWYLGSAVATAAASTVLLVIILWNPSAVISILGKNATEFLRYALLGALGGLISVMHTTRRANLNASQGISIHIFEGSMRIFGAIVGALLFNFAYACNLVGGVLRDGLASAQLAAGLGLISIVAGISEKFVPNLVSRIETSLISAPISKKNR